jgi:hypothetical protein
MKGRIFDFSSRGSCTNSSMRLIVIYIMLTPSGSQFKSNNYAKKHPPVVVSQWSSSYSEDELHWHMTTSELAVMSFVGSHKGWLW